MIGVSPAKVVRVVRIIGLNLPADDQKERHRRREDDIAVAQAY